MGSLRLVVEELEAHAAEAGWDRPAELFALVPTADLAVAEPALAQAMGLDPEDDGLTSVQQEALPQDRSLEEVVREIVWPPAVAGCAVVVERLVLPPGAEEQLPSDPEQASAYVAGHPDRSEVRMVAAVTRDGYSWCALRLRAHDEPSSVITGPQIVPALLELLSQTLADESAEFDPDQEHQ